MPKFDFPGRRLWEPLGLQPHNYVKKIQRLHRRGRLPEGLVGVRVEHDDWCPLLANKDACCTCRPVLRWTDPATGEARVF